MGPSSVSTNGDYANYDDDYVGQKHYTNNPKWVSFYPVELLEKGLRAHSSFKSTSSSVAILRRCSCDQSSMFFCSVCNFQTNVLFKVQRKFQAFEISLLEFGCISHIQTTHTSYRRHLHYVQIPQQMKVQVPALDAVTWVCRWGCPIFFCLQVKTCLELQRWKLALFCSGLKITGCITSQFFKLMTKCDKTNLYSVFLKPWRLLSLPKLLLKHLWKWPSWPKK